MTGVDTTTVKVEWAYPDYDTFITDNRGEGGGAGWWMPSGATAYKRAENPQASLEYTIDNPYEFRTLPGPYMVFDTTGTTGVVYSRFYDVEHVSSTGPYVNIDIGRITGSPTIVVSLEAFNDAGTNLGAVTQATGGSNRTATAAGWTTLTPYLTTIPSGTTKVRIKIDGVGVYGVRNVKIEDQAFDDAYWTGSYYTPDTKSGAPAIRSMWFDVTANTQAIRIQRGCRPNPPVDQLEIGTATVKFKTGPVNALTTTYDAIRRGFKVRVSGKNAAGQWVSVFEGRLVDIVTVEPVGKEAGWTEWRLEDRVADIARRDTTTAIKGTNVAQRMESVVNGDPANTSAPAIRFKNVTSTPYIGTEANAWASTANMLDHLLTLRNGDFGLLYCDATNQMQYISGQAGAIVPDVPNRGTLIFVGKNRTGSQKSPVLAGWDREWVNEYAVNSLSYSHLKTTNAQVNGTYSKRSLQIANGIRKGELAYIQDDSTPESTVLRGYLSEFAASDGTLRPALDQFQWDATNDVASVVTMDIYDNVEVYPGEVNHGSAGSDLAYYQRSDGTYAYVHCKYRVIGLEHEIKPGSWKTKVAVRPKERSNKTDTNY